MAFFWKKRSPEMRQVDLPGNCGTVRIPADFVAEMETDDTLLVLPPTNDSISLRFTSISFTKEGVSDEHVARIYLRQKATDEGLNYEESAGNGIVSYETENCENGNRLIVRFWEIASRNTLVILSATIPKGEIRNRIVKETLRYVPAIIATIAITKINTVINVDGREVQVTVEAVEPCEQAIREFADEELVWLAEGLNSANALGVKYGSGGEQTPEELDQVFSRWQQDDDEKENGEVVANALGAAFGDYLVDLYGFRWVVVTDEYGTDYAVRHFLGKTMAFPKSSVEKRIAVDDPEIFGNLTAAIVHQVREAEDEGN